MKRSKSMAMLKNEKSTENILIKDIRFPFQMQFRALELAHLH